MALSLRKSFRIDQAWINQAPAFYSSNVELIVPAPYEVEIDQVFGSLWFGGVLYNPTLKCLRRLLIGDGLQAVCG